VLRFPDGVDWGGEPVVVCVAIAAIGDGHVEILSELAQILLEPDRARELRDATAPATCCACSHRSGAVAVKVVRFHAPSDVRVEEAPRPTAGADEVSIRIRNCSTCGTDVKISKFGHHHIVPPRVMGTRSRGDRRGRPAVSGWAVGDRVQVIAAIPCGRCRDCLAGAMTVCANQESMGYHYDGGFADT
jgi:hypothetical protein